MKNPTTAARTSDRELVVIHDLYPAKNALDAAIASGGTGAYPEQFDQLDEMLAGRDGRAAP